MPLTEVQNAKIVIEIDRLRKEAERLEKQAADEEGTHEWAVRQYGSEMAGPSSSIARDRAAAKLLRDEVVFLEKIKKGSPDQKMHDDLRRELGAIEQKIKFHERERTILTERRGALIKDLDLFKRLEKVLSS